MLSEASENIMRNPADLELRQLQMLTEIDPENNTTTVYDSVGSRHSCEGMGEYWCSSTGGSDKDVVKIRSIFL